MGGFSVAIMAGGKSSRMGTDKSFVPLLGKPMIHHVVERLVGLGQDETFLVTNRPDDYSQLGLPMYGDVISDKGSLGGIYSAIHHSRSPYTLVVACDMPFVNAKLLEYMVSLSREEIFDVVVPRVEGYPEGLHAIYSKSCMEAIRTKLDADQLKVIGFYPDMQVRYIDEVEYESFDPKGLSFRNINTREELQEAQHLSGK
jgi:molybdopterin-guanine dinucleotide biosynthesis protein A